MQEGSVDIQKENIIENLKSRELEFVIVEEFFVNSKKEFSSKNNKTMKVVELKKLEQRSKTIEKFVQKFRRATKRSRYKKSLLRE